MSLHDISDLPVHPRTGLLAIGLLRNGAPIWPVLGASEDDVVADDTPTGDSAEGEADTGSADDQDTAPGDADATNDGEDDDDKPLGPRGEKALHAEKVKRREADRLRRTAARERDEALAELNRLKTTAPQKDAKADDASDDAPDLDAIRAEARDQAKAEAKAEVLKDRVGDKIEVLAAKRFQDASDAVVHLLRTSEIADFLDGDKIDAEAIKEALDELLEKKPYLAVPAQGEAKRFKGSADGGAKPTKQPRPTSVHEAVSRALNKT